MYRVLLLSIIIAFSYAQDQHMYWDYSPNPEDYDNSNYVQVFEVCVENPINNEYYCIGEAEENHCEDNSNGDIVVIKIDSNGNEISRNYLCMIDANGQGQTQYIHAAVYSDGYIYMLADGYINDGNYGDTNNIISQVPIFIMSIGINIFYLENISGRGAFNEYEF